jgi:PRTRC genetic system protein C
MGLTTKTLERIFLFKQDGENIELPEVSPSMSPEEHLKFYCAQYPEMAIANVSFSEVKNDKAYYKISSQPGDRG